MTKRLRDEDDGKKKTTADKWFGGRLFVFLIEIELRNRKIVARLVSYPNNKTTKANFNFVISSFFSNIKERERREKEKSKY